MVTSNLSERASPGAYVQTEPAQHDIFASFQEALSFPLDPFQLDSIQHLMSDRSVLVATPTSSGKTIVAEFAIHRALRQRRRVVYTSPLKALSNQKFGDFCRIWGHEHVGLLTGDVSVNPTAAVRVMTTEVLRNMLLQSPDGVDQVQTVVLDEFHYLGDAERGRVWEEIVILLPREIQLVALSATMSNAEQMRAWVARVHGETALVASDHRPVPLEIHYYHQGRLLRAVDSDGRQVARIKAGGEARHRRHPARATDVARPPAAGSPHAVSASEVLGELSNRDMLPAIYFLFSRSRTEREADKCAIALDLCASESQRARIDTAITETMAFMSEEHRLLPQVEAMVRLLRRGVAFHHAGLLPGLKVLVETLFAAGVLGVVFATETLALGINMPARSVIIPHLTKYDGTVRRPLASREFRQLIGRAGRRGMDVAGHAVLVYDEWMTFDEAMGIIKRPLEPVLSSFQLGYNSLINLLLTYRERDVLAWLMDQSLLAHQMVSRRQTLLAERARLEGSSKGGSPGCLIGGPDTLQEYERLLGRLEAARLHVEELEHELHASAHRRPRGVPDDEVRRWARQATGGELLYLTDIGWSVLIAGEGGHLAVPLNGLVDGAKRRRLSLHFDQVEAMMSPRTHAGRLELALLPHVGQRGNQPLPKTERLELRKQLASLELSLDEQASPAELDRREHIQQVERRHATAKAELEALTEQIQSHRCALCASLQEHRRLTRRTTSSSRLIANLDQEIAQLSAAEERDLRDVITDMMTVLETFGYLYQGECAAKSDVLAHVVDPNTLILTELVTGDMLDDLSFQEIAEIISWFAEPDSDGQYTKLKGALHEHWLMVRLLSERIMDLENRFGLFHSRGPSPAHPGLVRAWCKGTAFGELMATFEMSEGDGIRYLKKTGDLLRQIRHALDATELKGDLRERVKQAEQSVRRDIILTQELLELSEVIDVAAEDLPVAIRLELEEVSHDSGALHPPTAEHHHIDLTPATLDASPRRVELPASI